MWAGLPWPRVLMTSAVLTRLTLPPVIEQHKRGIMMALHINCVDGARNAARVKIDDCDGLAVPFGTVVVEVYFTEPESLYRSLILDYDDIRNLARWIQEWLKDTDEEP